MGRIKTSFIKRIGKEVYDKHTEEFTKDYSKNKQAVKKFLDVKSKKTLNIIAGYVTSLATQRKG
ncbi:30S ribosomal protein S17e [archaeon]|nr:MAG: 30S ribosomal protein S17e [archaeon]